MTSPVAQRGTVPTTRRAMALAAVVLVMCVLNVAVFAMVLGTGDDNRVATLRGDSIRAFLAAESGLSIAVTELNAGRSVPDGLLTLPGGETVQITTSAAVPPCTVVVLGRYGQAERRIEVELDSR